MRLGTKEVSTGNWEIGEPSDANGTPVKVELWTNGDSVNHVVSQLCLRDSKKVKELTEIASSMALSLELLNWNLGIFGNEKYVPVSVPHF